MEPRVRYPSRHLRRSERKLGALGLHRSRRRFALFLGAPLDPLNLIGPRGPFVSRKWIRRVLAAEARYRSLATPEVDPPGGGAEPVLPLPPREAFVAPAENNEASRAASAPGQDSLAAA